MREGANEEARARVEAMEEAKARLMVGEVGLGLSRTKLGISCLGLSLPALIPLVQFGFVYRLWDQHAMPVNRDHCSNSCWDTVFKAGYETGAGTYKHLYFNATIQAWVIWVVSLVAAILLYEAVKYMATLHIRKQLRWRMGLLFLTSVYPHYYAWWCMLNYFNDDFYSQLLHQTIFTLTELVCTLMVLHLSDKGIQASPTKLVLIMTLAASHIVVSGWDQFVSNVLLQEGFIHQVLRDLGFMLPDLLHIILPIKELQEVGRMKHIHPAYLIPNSVVIYALAYIFGFWLLSLVI